MHQNPPPGGNARPTECRLIIDPPAAGAWNMAVDEVLLVDAADAGVPTLRFYQWSEPTLSLGYFQRYDDRHQHAASRNCRLVRRQTGGGAILHDRELTYSLALPAAHPLARQVSKLYAAVHDAFIGAIEAAQPAGAQRGKLFRRDKPGLLAAAGEPFLCFQRQAEGDVVVVAESAEDHASSVGDSAKPTACNKILGSAQRRHRGAVLQHGSLLLERSPAAPELPGLADLAALSLNLAQLTESLGVRLVAALEVSLSDSRLPPALESKAGNLTNTKFGSQGWTNRR